MDAWWDRFAALAQRTLGLPEHLLDNIAGSLLVLVVYLIVRRLLRWVLERRVDDVVRRYTLGKTASYLLGFIALVAIVRVWIGNVTGLAAYLGLLSAGLAIGLTDPLTNLAGWIFLTVRRPFQVGDRIQIGPHIGDVIDQRLFQFTLVEVGHWVAAEQSTGRIIHVPNGWVFKQSQANYTEGFNFIWHEIPITVTFESDWKAAREILNEIAARHSAIRSESAAAEVRKAARKYLIYFQHLTPVVWTSLHDVGVTLTMRFLCGARRRRSTESTIIEEILTAFAERGDIDFAYPTTRFYDNVIEGKPEARATPAQS